MFGVIIKVKGMIFMDPLLNSLIAVILLAYPILSIPSIVKSKRDKGNFFSDSRFFIPKRVGYGIGINMHNIYGFFTLLFIGVLFLALSWFRI